MLLEAGMEGDGNRPWLVEGIGLVRAYGHDDVPVGRDVRGFPVR